MSNVIQGYSQRQLAQRGANSPQQFNMDQFAALRVSQTMPKYFDLGINRMVVAASSAGGTALAPVAAMPTTAAAWSIYNPVGSNKVLVPLTAFSWLVSGTSGLGGAQMVAKTNTVQSSALTAYASSVRQAMDDNTTPVGILAGGATLAETPAWMVASAGNTLAADALGAGFVSHFDGQFVVKEGCVFAMTVMDESGTTPLFGGGFTWFEIPASWV